MILVHAVLPLGYVRSSDCCDALITCLSLACSAINFLSVLTLVLAEGLYLYVPEELAPVFSIILPDS